MPLSFRRRIFVGLVGLGTLPLAAALAALALHVRSTGSPAGPRGALDEIAQSAHEMIDAVDTLTLSDQARTAVRAHTETISRRTALARRAETLSGYAATATGALILVGAAVLVAASLILARRWSAYTSAPIEELVGWVGMIQRRQILPSQSASGGAAEFEALRAALREMSAALEQARRQELEQERLAAFRETARRVAHEMRGPLTAAQLAIDQLSARGDGTSSSAIQVLREETERLEAMAREFSEFGRLPEGPEAPIDVAELVESVISATVPAEVPVAREIAPGLTVRGHFEPLRRALQNVVRNAVEASGGRGVEIHAGATGPPEDPGVRIVVADRGPGVSPELRHRIFEPYFTTKKLGTGLGLALARQTLEAHRGSIAVEDTPGGGASFVLTVGGKRT
ncbi:MAG: PAS domain-containing sensor histidine kinase [Gemmatimonadales bacterium]